jgi:hypothetical protein
MQGPIHPVPPGGFANKSPKHTIMPIRIKLTEDQTLVIRVDTEDWSRAYKSALDNNSMIEIREDGRTLAINPRQILFWEEIPDQDPAGVRQVQPA